MTLTIKECKMPIVLNRLNPGNDVPKMQELLTSADEGTRKVVYHGITEAIARVYAANADVTIPKPTLTIQLNDIINKVAELTVLDRELFGHMLKAKYDYFFKLYIRQEKSNPYEWKELIDVYGISCLYSPDDITLINSKFEMYRTAYITGHDWYVSIYLQK